MKEDQPGRTPEIESEPVAEAMSIRQSLSISPEMMTTPALSTHWTFLTNHAHVLILLARDPAITLREVAARVGITERAVQRIVTDLEQQGYIKRQKVGRQNHYIIHRNLPLRHPIEAQHTIGELLTLLGN
ncbi:MAG: hypothetical protein KatS3mg113_0407 [Planctomycetaceae bacterium]|nr:MAG: hypothetical protein KatS3mg113_0407 [Planctomycetaceae bacterium]